MKKLFIKLMLKVYYKFDIYLRKIIPLSCRVKLRSIVSRWLRTSAATKTKVLSNMTPGINLVGPIQSKTGLGQGCRLLAKAIDLTGIDWLVINADRKSANQSRSYPGRLVEQ